MKSDRLISLLLMLQSRRLCTARELSEALEVSERTVYRDVDSLCAAGIPVYAQRGSAGGIALSDGYRRALTHFNEDEIRALFVSGASPLADLGLDHGLERALAKLQGGLAEIQRRAAEKARSRIHLDGKRWNQLEPPRELLVALRRAVWDDRCVEMKYADRNRAQSVRRIDPLGLVSKAGVWYLIARTNGEFRSFRVDRIVDARELPEQFERPSDFALEDYWRESSARFQKVSRLEECVATVRVAIDAIERIEDAYWPVEVFERGELYALARVTFPHVDAAAFQLVAWAGIATLLEPAAARDAVVARARQVLECYATSVGGRSGRSPRGRAQRP
ncbi:MAG TPA: YafY family protein [Candidatus Acidoferrales bacterium]|nr:YafY family protein [Candidatus Acidoferrales bacterium]